jgi:hypothetical protein
MGFVNFGLGASGISQIGLSGGRVKEGGRGGVGRGENGLKRGVKKGCERGFL